MNGIFLRFLSLTVCTITLLCTLTVGLAIDIGWLWGWVWGLVFWLVAAAPEKILSKYSRKNNLFFVLEFVPNFVQGRQGLLVLGLDSFDVDVAWLNFKFAGECCCSGLLFILALIRRCKRGLLVVARESCSFLLGVGGENDSILDRGFSGVYKGLNIVGKLFLFLWFGW